MSLFEKQINHYYNETNHKYVNEPYEVTHITNFEDNHTDSIIYYEHVSKGVYGDEGFCIGELIRQTLYRLSDQQVACQASRLYRRGYQAAVKRC